MRRAATTALTTLALGLSLVAWLAPASAASIDDSDCHLTPAQIEKGVKCVKDDLNAIRNAPISGVKDLGMATISGYLLSLVGTLALLYLIYGGVRYTSAGDDLERLDAAKRTMKYAVVGLVVTLLAYVIVSQALRLLYAAG